MATAEMLTDRAHQLPAYLDPQIYARGEARSNYHMQQYEAAKERAELLLELVKAMRDDEVTDADIDLIVGACQFPAE